MVRTQIQLTEEQARAIKKIAISRHLSVAELIRQAVDAMIKSSAIIDTEERRKRAIDIAGRFSSGKHDISREHDKYLMDAFSK
ncbi:MAG: ribbon-helix-helix domain-containing protein [Nitrospirota bacterium]|nr:ribbon-helix-helix domain-containing protein [Nitrospirota bacterium]MDH5768204.1 ribbon-helix-helix domain-containing protein [Nitrospirota bacterium]